MACTLGKAQRLSEQAKELKSRRLLPTLHQYIKQAREGGVGGWGRVVRCSCRVGPPQRSLVHAPACLRQVLQDVPSRPGAAACRAHLSQASLLPKLVPHTTRACPITANPP